MGFKHRVLVSLSRFFSRLHPIWQNPFPANRLLMKRRSGRRMRGGWNKLLFLLKAFLCPWLPSRVHSLAVGWRYRCSPQAPPSCSPPQPAPLRPQRFPSSYVAFCPATTERLSPSEREDKFIIVICELVIFVLAFSPEFTLVSKCGKIANFKGITMDYIYIFFPIQNHICF